MKIFQTVAALVFVLVSAPAAYAGGLSDYTPLAPVNACGGPYSGFYAGGVLGMGGLNSKVSSEGGSLKGNDRGFTIGGVTGYNWQCNSGLLGIETDISYFNANSDADCAICGASQSFNSEINWFGTLRGRIGVVGDQNFLVFATGGLAYGAIDHTARDSLAPGGPFSQTDSDTEIGWTAGGGIEYLLSDRWAFRADALYVDFGSEDHTYTAGGCGELCTARLSWDDNFWVARVGLTYLFGAAPREPVTEYEPLK